ncbi:hypothetical protein QYF61_003945 [Mycteria americana]|uniref:Uncharacterized protein n=1 Tax=Mycteria americana TaxID=33587 RepID=A0AAN7NJH8_MYCAM|nr:hypothetical protein QYF61_003945 [Mycteria americana]
MVPGNWLQVALLEQGGGPDDLQGSLPTSIIQSDWCCSPLVTSAPGSKSFGGDGHEALGVLARYSPFFSTGARCRRDAAPHAWSVKRQCRSGMAFSCCKSQISCLTLKMEMLWARSVLAVWYPRENEIHPVKTTSAPKADNVDQTSAHGRRDLVEPGFQEPSNRISLNHQGIERGDEGNCNLLSHVSLCKRFSTHKCLIFCKDRFSAQAANSANSSRGREVYGQYLLLDRHLSHKNRLSETARFGGGRGGAGVPREVYQLSGVMSSAAQILSVLVRLLQLRRGGWPLAERLSAGSLMQQPCRCETERGGDVPKQAGDALAERPPARVPAQAERYRLWLELRSSTIIVIVKEERMSTSYLFTVRQDDDVDLEALVNDMNSSFESLYSTCSMQSETTPLLQNGQLNRTQLPSSGPGALQPMSPRQKVQRSQPVRIMAVRRLQEEEQQFRTSSLPAIPNPFPELCSPASSPVLAPGSLPQSQPASKHVLQVETAHFELSFTKSNE